MPGYTIEGVSGLPEYFAKRIIITRFGADKEAAKRYLEPYRGTELYDTIEGQWYEISPIAPAESANHEDLAVKRLLFWAIRPERLFPSLSPTLMDTYDREVPGPVWDKDGNESQRTYRRRYELYQVDPAKLGVTAETGSSYINVLRCWCPSTGNEHWIMLQSRGDRYVCDVEGNSAKNAAADLLRISTYSTYAYRDCKGTDAIYRQGDIVFRSDNQSHWDSVVDELDNVIAEA